MNPPLVRGSHIRLTSHPGSRGPARFPLTWGAADRRGARSGHRHGQFGRRPQRDRRPWRLLFHLPRAGDLLRGDGPAGAAGPAGHLAGLRDRPAPAMGRARQDRLARPLGPPGRAGFRRPDRRGHRHPPVDRDHQGAADPARDPGAIAAGRLEVDGEIVHEAGDISVTKIAVDPVWWLPGVAERFGVERMRTSAAACSSRPAACIPSSSPGPICRSSCRRSAA